MIVIGTIRLISETFIEIKKSDSALSYFFDVFDCLLNIVFIVECVLKILGMGFIMQKGSYLRDSWNKLDFLIVLISLFDFYSIAQKYSSTNSINNNLGFLKVLRMLRILRPLRFISHNVQLKLIINSLLDSIQSIFNVFVIVLIVFFVFAIIGISIFYSLFYQCYIDGEPLKNFASDMAEKNITLTSNTTEFLNVVSLLLYFINKILY